MKKFVLAAAAALLLAACETPVEAPMPRDTSASPMIAPAGRPADMPVEARAGEQRAQDCVQKGFQPGSDKFSLCMGREAEKAVASAPEPRRKPQRNPRKTASQK